ncbi:MAG: hypothetical protein COA79_06710 [Planctomycetota bacterium]|nr:MAG: hypothetical protein COA79_06710 [Planctomycetota bacterium]
MMLDWFMVNITACICSGVAFLICFLTMGLPGFLFYGPTIFLYEKLGFGHVLIKIQGDSTWPMLILGSFLGSILVVPIHLLVIKIAPSIAVWNHVLMVVMIIWLITVFVNVLMIFDYSRKH